MTWLRTPLRAFSISQSSIGPVFTRSISASIAASSSATVLPGATVPMTRSRPGPRVSPAKPRRAGDSCFCRTIAS